MMNRGNETPFEREEREGREADEEAYWERRDRHLPVILDSDDPDDVPWEPKPVVNPEIRTNAATRDWKEARRLAEQNGFRLLRQSRSHYQLMMPDRAWVLNIFPGPCLLRRDVDRPPPYIELARIKWTLREVVEAMIVRLGCPKPKEDPQK